jgi:hypothetical protein
MMSEKSCLGRMARISGHVALGLVVAVTFGLIFGWVVMLSWNAVIPELVTLPAIDYWQAVALLVLGRILFGRLTHGGHGRRRFKRRHHASLPETMSAELYTEWWDSEGEAAFKAYLARQ